MYITRKIESYLKRMIRQFPILSITGPRQSGKTTLLKSLFPEFKYYNLERPDYRELILSDPVGFLKSAGAGIIFDEAQNIPELFSYIQVISDERGTPGQYILSGSQSFLMNEQISQSLAGRVHISHLFPFDITELPDDAASDFKKAIWNGFYPRLYKSYILPTDFYPSYLQTYIERDVRSLKNIGNLNTFSRFLGLCAGRIGQVLNLSSLANDTGITVNTAKAWLSLLESSFILFQLQPYHKNYSKRLIKSPKIYFYDTGLACSMLRITNPEMIETHYLYGLLFENLAISEIVKSQHHLGKPAKAYYWRESNGVEIDCILELENDRIMALEIKGGESFSKDYLKNLKNFPGNNDSLIKKLIYAGKSSSDISGVSLIGWKDFGGFLGEIG
ncbi:MAG: ATP-binding protein [Bacteroidales bacterium]|nr:ATP-binding protein [Bacteroidales bacterium]MCF8390643.1 ATP-binding protein [Bacteroidales bacterium]